MPYPSLVCMTQVPQFCHLDDILTVIRKQGHHPIKGVVSKVRNICLIQFADSIAAAEAVSQLNGKSISFSAHGFCTKTTFHLIQCPENNFKLHIAWVGDLDLQVDQNELFKFFGDRFNNLFDARVMTDNDGKSRGFGYLAFSTEEDQIFCIKTMDGSLEFGNRVIRVKPVTTGSPGNYCPVDTSSQILGIDASYNKFIEPTEFIAVKANLAACKNKKGGKDDEVEPIPSDDLRLVEYNETSNADYIDNETLERDYHLWDALACSKWLPPMALNLSINELFSSKESSKTKEKKPDDANVLPNGTNVDDLEVTNVLDKLVACSEEMFVTKVPQRSLRKSEDVAEKPLEIIHLHVIGPLLILPQTDGKRYIVVFVDEYSRLGVEYFIENMTELGQKFESFLKDGRKQLGRHAEVRYLHVCSMKNFIGDCMRTVLNREAISLQQTPSDVPPLATRFATVLLRKVRSLMLDSGLPNRLWTLAVAMAVYIYNCTPLDSLDYEIPYERFAPTVQQKPHYFTRFGCVAYVKLPLNIQPTNGEFKRPSRSIPNGTLWPNETEKNSNDETNSNEKNGKIVRYFFVGYQYSAYLLFHPESNTFTKASQIWCNEKMVYGDVYSQSSVEHKDTDWFKSLSIETESIPTKDDFEPPKDDFEPPSKKPKTENHVLSFL